MFSRLHGSLLTGSGARLALIAIALQLLLSFAHIHPPVTVSPQVAAQTGPGSAPDNSPLMAHDCAICANIAAFHGLTLPMTFILAVAIGWIIRLPPLPLLRLTRSTGFPYFRTRAPPAV